MQTPRLLALDDDPEITEIIAAVASEAGFDVRTTNDHIAFSKALTSFEPTVITLDLNMPSVDGFQLTRILAEQKTTARTILVSGVDTRVIHTASKFISESGVTLAGVIRKPFSISELRQKLHEIKRGTADLSPDDLRAALRGGELRVYYQPKIAVGSHLVGERAGRKPRSPDIEARIVGAEALVRWAHPDRGLLLPDAFIELAEHSRLMVPLTAFVLRSSLEAIVGWRQHGAEFPVSVNLSATLLYDEKLPERLTKLVHDFGLKPADIVLEITEDAAMGDVKTAMEILSRFRLKGFGLSMDDFGTGYTSLRELYRMPFNEIKIDRSFLEDMDETQEARTIVRSITNLAHDLGLSVCAEGVETTEALKAINEIGCDTAQGFLAGRPAPAHEITKTILLRNAAGRKAPYCNLVWVRESS